MKTIVSAKISNVKVEPDEADFVYVNKITLQASLWAYGTELTHSTAFHISNSFSAPEVGDIVLVEFDNDKFEIEIIV